MIFKKIKSTLFIAKGNNGNFVIKKKCGLWWGLYIKLPNGIVGFRLPPSRFLKAVKQLCKDNYYWED